MKETLLQLQKGTVRFGAIKALTDVDIALDEGEIVTVMGPNGAGKSTVIKSLFGVVDLQNGKVLWHENAVNPIPYEQVARGISYVPQGRQIFTSLSVKENLEMGGYTVKSAKERKQRIEEVLDIFPDLRTKLKQSARQLSGGQQQMLAIARGLMTDPKVLLLDEPTLGLSPKLVKEVFAKIKEISERRGTSILVVEHNIKSLLTMTTRAYVLARGEVVFSGTPKELEESKILDTVFTE